MFSKMIEHLQTYTRRDFFEKVTFAGAVVAGLLVNPDFVRADNLEDQFFYFVSRSLDEVKLNLPEFSKRLTNISG